MANLMELPLRDGATWFGGRRRARFEVQGEEAVDQVVWVEEGTMELRMAQVVPSGRGDDVLWEALEMACEEPVQGDPARPARVVVSDHGAKRFLEEKVGGLGVHVSFRSDLPEVEHALEFLDQVADSPVITYLEQEGADPQAVAHLFERAERFWEAEPWKWLSDVEFLTAEVEGTRVVLSVMGQDDTEYGLAVFDSPEQVQAFLDASEEEKSSLVRLFMVFASPDEVGLTAVAEAEENEWPLVEGELYPMVINPTNDAHSLATAEDLRLVCRLMDAVRDFADRGWWQQEKGTETVTLEDGVEVRLEWPLEGIVIPPEEDAGESLPRPLRPGRNEPCWCGSGRKYKKCHLDEDEKSARVLGH